MSTLGTFVWFDLMTPSLEKAVEYYTYVFGWGTQDWDGPMPYTMFTAEGTAIGGVMTLPADAGAAPHWLGYIACDDVKRTVERVASLGGKVLQPVHEIPTVGWYAVIADPQGCVLGLYQSKTPDALVARNRIGTMSWAELNTTDWERAWKFYSSLFGWKPTSSMDMGGTLGQYFMFEQADGSGQSMGGMSNVATMMGTPAHWLFYTNVVDIDAGIARVKERGGQVLNGPMDVPGGGKIAQCSDPQGALFALYTE